MNTEDHLCREDLEVRFQAAVAEEIETTLKAGIPVFYRESEIYVMENPDRRRFEIRFIANAPSHHRYDIIRELKRTAA